MDLEELVDKAARFEKFLSRLTPFDLVNFQAAVALPKAKELIEKCPDREYKEMALFALSLLQSKKKGKKKK